MFSRKLHKCITPIQLAITEIQTILTSHGIPIKYSLTEKVQSPLKPTDFRMEIFKKSGLENLFNKKKNIFLKELKEKLGKDFTPYDVQEKSIKLMIEKKNNKEMNKAKEYAFNNGIEIETILRIGGLILRDGFLENQKQK